MLQGSILQPPLPTPSHHSTYTFFSHLPNNDTITLLSSSRLIMSNSSPPLSPLQLQTPPPLSLRSTHYPRPRRVNTLPTRLIDPEASEISPSPDAITTLFYVEGARITAIGGGSAHQGSSGGSSRPGSRAGANYFGDATLEGDHNAVTWITPSDRTLAVGKLFLGERWFMHTYACCAYWAVSIRV
jgi:hypothetical protein